MPVFALNQKIVLQKNIKCNKFFEKKIEDTLKWALKQIVFTQLWQQAQINFEENLT